LKGIKAEIGRISGHGGPKMSKRRLYLGTQIWDWGNVVCFQKTGPKETIDLED